MVMVWLYAVLYLILETPCEYHCTRGDDYAKYGYLDKAVIEYRTAVRLDSKCIRGWRGLAVLHYFEGGIDDAMKCLDRVLTLVPEDSQALLLKNRIEADFGLVKFIPVDRMDMQIPGTIGIKFSVATQRMGFLDDI